LWAYLAKNFVGRNVNTFAWVDSWLDIFGSLIFFFLKLNLNANILKKLLFYLNEN
jgi:hypothetical protein